MNLILGSKSPRRSELLKRAGFEFVLRVKEIDETYPENLAIESIAEYIACQKAKAQYETLKRGDLLLTADTIVVFDNEVYGKPASEKEAVETILRFSNKVHLVYSGVCLRSLNNEDCFSECSEVKFGSITRAEAERYVRECSPLDKAGSYGIQDWIGFARIEWIKGSYTNILGLPLAQTYDKLKMILSKPT